MHQQINKKISKAKFTLFFQRYLVTEYSVSGRDSAADTAVFRSNSLMDCLNNAIRHLHGVQGIALSKAGLLGKRKLDEGKGMMMCKTFLMKINALIY